MQIDNREMIVDSFLDTIRYLKVVHHLPGRIRVKASLNGARKLAEIDAEKMNDVIARLPGIKNYRVNRKAFSVIVEYDPRILPFDLWENVGSLNEYPAHRESVRTQLLDILAKHLEEV